MLTRIISNDAKIRKNLHKSKFRYNFAVAKEGKQVP